MELGWIGEAVNGVGSVVSAVVNSKSQHDTLNKESEINDTAYAHSVSLAQLQTQSYQKIAMIIVGSIIFLMITWALIHKISR